MASVTFVRYALLFWLGFGSLVGLAQQYTHFEAGVGLAGNTFSDQQQTTTLHGYTGGVNEFVTYNLSPSLAVESNVSYLPYFQRSNWQDSGSEWVAVGGLKMGHRGKRYGLYGKIEPGIASFSCGFSYIGPNGQPYADCQRRTHFALDYGLVGEYSLSRRNAIRLDAAQTLITEFDQVLSRYTSPPSLAGLPFQIVEGQVAQHFDLHLSLVHRFGSLREEEQTTSSDASPKYRFDVGVLYVLQPKVHMLLHNLEPDSGGGLWASWNFSRYVSFDTSAFYLPHNDLTYSVQEGGPVFEAYTGLKAGIRRQYVGIFAKVRPGVIVFGETEDSMTAPPYAFSFSNSKFATPALDTGGVVEIYPYHRLILRTEAGEASLFYRSKTVYSNGQPFKAASTEEASALFLFGVGYRF